MFSTSSLVWKTACIAAAVEASFAVGMVVDEDWFSWHWLSATRSCGSGYWKDRTSASSELSFIARCFLAVIMASRLSAKLLSKGNLCFCEPSEFCVELCTAVEYPTPIGQAVSSIVASFAVALAV